MSGRGEAVRGSELEAVARRLAALADRIRALRARLSGEAASAPPGGSSAEESARAKGPAH
jgi:hypothetical protein